MTLTEKIRENVGGKAFRVFEITGMSAVACTLSVGSFQMNYIDWATYSPTICTLSAGSTTIPGISVAESSAGGTDIVLDAHAASGDSGVITLWGK